jgi:hypothetical protein
MSRWLDRKAPQPSFNPNVDPITTKKPFYVALVKIQTISQTISSPRSPKVRAVDFFASKVGLQSSCLVVFYSDCVCLNHAISIPFYFLPFFDRVSKHSALSPWSRFLHRIFVLVHRNHEACARRVRPPMKPTKPRCSIRKSGTRCSCVMTVSVLWNIV